MHLTITHKIFNKKPQPNPLLGDRYESFIYKCISTAQKLSGKSTNSQICNSFYYILKAIETLSPLIQTPNKSNKFNTFTIYSVTNYNVIC